MSVEEPTKRYRILRRLAGGEEAIVLGTASLQSDGWRFTPNQSNRRPRRAAKSFEDCLPRWVGYPDRCESEVVS